MQISDPPIASGRTAEIYAWGEGRILKLLRPGFPPALVQQEEAITAFVRQAGIPAPEISAVVEVDERPGIVYERVDGPAMIAEMERHPFRMKQYAAQLAGLHAAIHARSYSPAPAGAPRQKQILARQIRQAEVLPAAQRGEVLSLLDSLPGGDTLCHNDFHPLNVLMGPAGAVIIDWESASLGVPCADVARTVVTVALARPAEGFPNRLEKILSEGYLRTFIAAYLASYRSLAHDPLEDLCAWETVQAAAKVQWEAQAHQGLWLDVVRRGLENIRRGRRDAHLL